MVLGTWNWWSLKGSYTVRCGRSIRRAIRSRTADRSDKGEEDADQDQAELGPGGEPGGAGGYPIGAHPEAGATTGEVDQDEKRDGRDRHDDEQQHPDQHPDPSHRHETKGYLGQVPMGTIPPVQAYVEPFTDDEVAVLSRFFTNVDQPVFALMNLPEVVKGALFARYSRSAKSLRRLFLDEFVADPDAGIGALVGVQEPGLDIDRAERLYQRVFIEYGDDSVAQLGGAHLAVEQASNLLTKALEWGRLAAYLEQSTRYIPYDIRLGRPAPLRRAARDRGVPAPANATSRGSARSSRPMASC